MGASLWRCSMTQGVVIIGGGECGVSTAFSLRFSGFDGPITILNGETHLPYERPPLSKGGAGSPKPIRNAADYADAKIDLRHDVTVTKVDRDAKQVTTSTGEALAYDKLVFATGARSRVFDGLAECLTLRTWDDAAALDRKLHDGARIGIIGGGFIGLELAALARQRGASVTVLEANPWLMARAVPTEIAKVVHQKHLEAGVTVQLGQGATSVTDGVVRLVGGGVLEFDTVIAGVGAVPNTELAAECGLRVENGICVDDGFRTSDPEIFAAGDCCRFSWRGQSVRLESWKAAQDQAQQVAASILGEAVPYNKVPWFWSDQYDLTLQVAGIFDPARPVIKRKSDSGKTVVFQCGLDGEIAAAAGIGVAGSTANDIKVFEKLIERGTRVDPMVLADPEQNLKRLLRAA